jgi:hypothetical protein
VSAADILLAPADRARRGALRVAAWTTLGRLCLRDRSIRLPLLAVGHAALALSLASIVPLWAILLGPLVLGVPHLMADVRYLVLDRPGGLSDRQVLAILLPLVVAAALGVALPLGGSSLVVSGLLAIAGAVALARARPAGRIAAILFLVAAAVPLCAQPDAALLCLSHVHNVVAVALWLWLPYGHRRVRPLLRYAAAAVFLAGGVLISLGAFDSVPRASAGWFAPAEGFDVMAVGRTLALPGFDLHRSLMLFAYAQAVHYSVWLRLIPGERSTSESPASFRRSLEGLRSAFGPRGLMIALSLAVAVPLAGMVAPVATRRLYLDLAGVHAWLELAVAAHLGLAWMGASKNLARAR